MYVDRQKHLKDEFCKVVHEVLIECMFEPLDFKTKNTIEHRIVARLYTFTYDYDLKLAVTFNAMNIDITLFAKSKWDPKLFLEVKTTIDNSVGLYKGFDNNFQSVTQTQKVSDPPKFETEKITVETKPRKLSATWEITEKGMEVFNIPKKVEIDYLAIAIEVCGGTSN